MTRYQRQLGFKKGDKVVVKRNCEVFVYSESYEMRRYRERQTIGTVIRSGKEITIVSFIPYSYVETAGWSYHPDELELVSKK